MSRDLLNLLREFGAFDPAPRHAELHDMHVKYDTLTGQAHCEKPLLTGLMAGDRIALIGDSGAGKSSIIAHTLGPLVEGIFPIPVPVYPEPAKVVGNPTEFVAHLVRTISRMLASHSPTLARPARSIERHTVADRPARAHRFSAGWHMAGVGPELAYELTRAVAEPAPTAGQIMDQGRQILELVASDGLVPILILDDTDRWLSTSRPDITTLRRDFFYTVPRLLSTELGTAAVIAVHPHYLEDSGYQGAQGFMTKSVRVPRLPSPQAMATILLRRIEIARDAAVESISEVFTPDAIDVLFAHYSAWPSNLRRNVLLPAHSALSLALDDDVEQIDEGHVLAAVTG